jgi:hypothetical protein
VAKVNPDLIVRDKSGEIYTVHRVVTNSVDFAIGVTRDQMGIHLLDLFSNKAELRDTVGVEIWLVAERDRLKRENRFAGLVHRFDRFLEARRGGHVPSLPLAVTKTATPPEAVAPLMPCI